MVDQVIFVPEKSPTFPLGSWFKSGGSPFTLHAHPIARWAATSRALSSPKWTRWSVVAYRSRIRANYDRFRTGMRFVTELRRDRCLILRNFQTVRETDRLVSPL